MNNGDLPARLGSLNAGHTSTWVEESQPVRTRTHGDVTGTREGSPPSHVLDELEAEYSSQGTIRRKFILDTYQNRPAIELFIATRVWGSGPDNRGPAKAGRILSEPDASAKIEDTVSTVRKDGAADSYRAYFARNKIENLGIAFVTKLLYFAGYRSPHRPRPLIYDSLAAAAAARLPSAPLLPAVPGSLTTSGYERYCAWAENLAAKHQTVPAVIEWSLFTLGAAIRDELRN